MHQQWFVLIEANTACRICDFSDVDAYEVAYNYDSDYESDGSACLQLELILLSRKKMKILMLIF